MTRPTPGDDEAGPDLHLWITEMPGALREMRTEVLEDDFPFDFSPASLVALEAHMLLEYGSAGERVTMDYRPTLGAMIYLGEVLMTITGGAWGWWNRRKAPGSGAGQPIICPDPALGLEPITPLLLIARATRRRTGEVFAQEVARLHQAVAELKERDPGWDRVAVSHPEQAARQAGTDHPELVQWLDRRTQAFPAWARQTGTTEQWDFSPASLDRLEDVVRGRFAGSGEIVAAKSSPFVQGAVWYIGEVIRHAKPGVLWQYQPRSRFGELAEAMFCAGEEIFLDTPMVGQPGLREGGTAYPMGLLNVLFWEQDELDNPIDSHLCDVLDAFA